MNFKLIDSDIFPDGVDLKCTEISAMKEYNCQWIGGKDIIMENKKQKELLLGKQEIKTNGKYRGYVLVNDDELEKFHENGYVVGIDKRIYSSDKEALGAREYDFYFSSYSHSSLSGFILEGNKPKELRKTIREELLEIKENLFEIEFIEENSVLNKNDNTLKTNDYKVIQKVKLNPNLCYEIVRIGNNIAEVKFYNSLTMKSKTVNIGLGSNYEELELLIRDYISKDEKDTAIMNDINNKDEQDRVL